MFTSKPRSTNGLLLLVAVVGLIFGSAGPAAASHYSITGGGTDSPGEEWGPNLDQLCSDNNNQFTGAQFETTYYLITESNFTFLLYDTGFPVAYYSGPISMNIQHGDAVFGPQGAAPGECTGSEITPAPVPLTKATAQGAVNGSTGQPGAVNCQSRDTTPGTYTRVASDVTFDFDVSCTVKGNESNLYASRYVWTTFTISGTQNTSGYLKLATTGIAVSGSGH